MELPAWKVEERERGMIDLENILNFGTGFAFIYVSLHRMRGAVYKPFSQIFHRVARNIP